MHQKSSGRAALGAIFGFALLTAAIGFQAQRLAKPYLARQQADQALQGPLFRALQQYEPGTYQTIRFTLIEGIKSGKKPEEVGPVMHVLMSRVAEKYVLKASDRALCDYMRVTMDEIEEASRKDPGAGYAIMFPSSGEYALGDYVSKATLDRDRDLLAQVITTGAQNQATPLDESAARKMLTKLQKQLRARFGDDVEVLTHGWRPDVDKKKFCEVSVAMYRSVLELPTNEAAQVLRLVLG